MAQEYTPQLIASEFFGATAGDDACERCGFPWSHCDCDHDRAARVQRLRLAVERGRPVNKAERDGIVDEAYAAFERFDALVEHPATSTDPKLRRAAADAAQALWQFYQRTGGC